MILPYYNCVTGEMEYRESPSSDEATARQFIPQDEKCQAEYTRLLRVMNKFDAYYEACLFAVKHHGFTGDKDSPHSD